MEIQPITLYGRYVRLEPLNEAHIPGLALAGRDEAIWRYMRYGPLTSPERMHAWVRYMLDLQTRGADLPFAVIHLPDQAVAGATRYLNINRHDRNLEIGGTWYGPAYQRTAVNTECKYLLLQHAFEDLGCLRVQIKTDLRNTRSRRAIERLGATQEGILREHILLPDGYLRSSVIYSILLSEWPEVKQRLEGFLLPTTGNESPP
jgi:RimJ/RimL family protein N-acetyltransferase